MDMSREGRVLFDESDAPLYRTSYEGVPSKEEWDAHFHRFTRWARSGIPYAVVIDARQVGSLPATHRKAIVAWIDRDRFHLTANCRGGALVFSNRLQRGLWTAITWVTPIPVPVKVFGDLSAAEDWLTGLLHRKAS
jgi:hypothetical protein